MRGRRIGAWAAAGAVAVAGVGAVGVSLGSTGGGSDQPAAAAADSRAWAGSGPRAIGQSVSGRQIVATPYGDESAPRVLVLVGSMHGTEPGGLSVVDRVAAAGAVPGTRTWVVRTVNPDGLLARTRANARGVDLNRNTPHRWRRGSPGVYYPGTAPASEPETVAYMRFLTGVRPDLVLSFHQDLVGVDSYGAKDLRLVRWLSRKLRLPVKSFACTGVCRGTMTGWFNSHFPGNAVTIELPGRVSAPKARSWAAAVRQIAATMPGAS